MASFSRRQRLPHYQPLTQHSAPSSKETAWWILPSAFLITGAIFLAALLARLSANL